MRHDQLTHGAACRPGHPITPDCLVDCLRAVLPGRVVNRLARADGIRGQDTAPGAAPPTVGDVIRVYRHGRLGEIRGLGVQSVLIIGDCLDLLGLTVPAGDSGRIMPECPVDCLLAVISARVVNRLARADGRHGQPAAPCGAPATVADVIGLYRQGRLGQIPGLGVKAITEIEAGLVFAGLSLKSGRD